MRCEAIRPLIRTFLDDLLDEKDYQEVQAHLGGCDRCHNYAGSVGTLSFRLHELGRVSVPPDMSSTIVYGLEKERHTASSASMDPLPSENGVEELRVLLKRIFWAVVLLVLAVTAVAATMIAGFRRTDQPVSAPAPEPESTPDEEDPEQ